MSNEVDSYKGEAGLNVRAFERASFRRDRILTRLSSATRYPITVIIAAAGFGKTTAVRQYLERCADFLIVQTPQGATLQKFVREFTRACAARFPSMGTPPSDQMQSIESTNEAAEVYAGWASAHISGDNCVIVVDDLHFADEHPAVAMFLTLLVDATKSTTKWILVTRTRGTVPLTRWQAYGDADAPIIADELRMTEVEAKQFASAIGSPASQEQLAQWVQQTNGFPVPLSYAIRLSARRGNIDGIADGTRALTFEFLAEQLWSSLDEADRALLEVAAFLPHLHMHDYENAGIDGASSSITRLSADIAFLVLSNNHFGMHDLFRDFVLHRVMVAGPRTALNRKERAVRILSCAGLHEDALRIIADCRNPAWIIDFVEQLPTYALDPGLIRDIILVCEKTDISQFGIQMLCIQADYWAWKGEANKTKLFSAAILSHPKANSEQLLLAIFSSCRSIDLQPEREQREWLLLASKHIDRLSPSGKIQVDAFRALILARYNESREAAAEIIKVNVGNFSLLNSADRLSVETATANASYWLGDVESTLRFSRDAVSSAVASGDKRQQARALNNLGIILQNVYNAEVSSLFDPLKIIVEDTASWRFSHTSHWLPSFYFALKGDLERADRERRLQTIIKPLEESQRLFLRSFRRHSDNLGNILAEDYEKVLGDFSRGEPIHEKYHSYAIHVDNAVALTMTSNIIAARKMLANSGLLRAEIPEVIIKSMQEVVLMEVVCLGLTGQWLKARKLCEQGIGSEPALAPAKEMLKRFCDGPPFVGVREAQQRCIDQPFIGLAAILVGRAIEQISFTDDRTLLTAAETDVLKLLSLGKSNKAIADARSRSTETVKRQVAAIYKKLGVENRTSALAAAKERGIV